MNTYYIERDSTGQPIAPPIILAHKSGKKIGVLNIDEQSLVIKVELQDSQLLYSEFSCDVHKYINTYLNPLWEDVKNFKTVCIPISIPHIKARSIWYEIEVTIDDEDDTVKHLTGTSAQYTELDQVNNYEVEIRTEEDMARDDYKDTVFYNPDDPDASIVHRVLHDKAGHYTIAHVDKSLWNVKRSFSFNGTSVIDCLKDIANEVDCIITLGETTSEDDLALDRTISFYDAKDYCPVCGKRGDFTDGCTNPECDHSKKIVPRYGKDTTIFVNKENLGESINWSVNVDDVKNCFRLSAGDDEMTTAVILCNPAGSRYLWRFTDDMRADMSDELRERFEEYEAEYNNYKYFFEMDGVFHLADYNTIYQKYEDYIKDKLALITDPIIGYTNLVTAYYYTTYLKGFLENTMFPDSPDVVETTASEELNKYTNRQIGIRSLSSLSRSVAVDEIEENVKLYVDYSRYRIDIETTSYEDRVWTGAITLTSYTDDEDTASLDTTITFTQATGKYLKEQIDRFMEQRETVIAGVVDLCKQEESVFKAEIKKYNLNSLIGLRASLEAVLSILDDAEITQATQPDVYQQIYKPFADKKDWVDAELQIREQEVDKLQEVINEIENQMVTINTALDLESYLGEELWSELLYFRRESEQSDSTIISTGLTDAELIENAMEFYTRVDENVDKLTESQYSISCTLKDLLLMLPDTYQKYIPDFDVGNWLRIEVDDKIYKLRLLSYEIDFKDLTTIQVEFGSAKTSNAIVSAFHEVMRTAENASQGIADISKQLRDNDLTNDIVGQITSYSYTPDGRLVANLNGSTIVMGNSESLEQYLQRTIKDTNGSLTITLTNEFQGVSTDETGQGGDYSTCNTEVNVIYNGTDITSDPEIDWDIIIPQTATGTWNVNTHTVTVTNIQDDYAVIEIFASYRGLDVKKNFIVKKIKTGSSPIVVNIESSGGNIFKNKKTNTVLTCTIMQGTRDITSSASTFHWIKYDANGNVDQSWNPGNVRTVTLRPADVSGKAVFKCEVTLTD